MNRDIETKEYRFNEEKTRRKGIMRNCLVCDKFIYVTQSRISYGWGKYCSRSCRNKSEDSRIAAAGEKNSNWKGGKIKRPPWGYIYIRDFRHPNRSKDNYVAEHRLVMEQFLGRYLTLEEQVHHKNKVKDDNRIENLELVIKTNHYGELQCPHCNKTFKIQ